MRLSCNDKIVLRTNAGESRLTPLVYLDGELIGKVKAFDSDEGWVDLYETNKTDSLTRKTGKVEVAFKVY